MNVYDNIITFEICDVSISKFLICGNFMLSTHKIRIDITF